MSLPKESKYVACVAWTVLSWSKLLQYYQMDNQALDSKRMLYLSTWLFEQEKCLESPWIQFAIATGFMNSFDDKNDPNGQQKRKEYASRIITSLWDHAEIGSFVRLWYITYRLQEGEYTKKELASWMFEVKQIQQNGKQEEAKQLETLLRVR
jgi:hypothetical protein